MQRKMLTVLCVLVPWIASAQAVAVAQTPVERGQAVYAAQKCGVCHSVAGVGNKRGVLDGVGTKLSADMVRQWITNAPEMTAKAKAERKPVMKAYPNLPKDDLGALVAYLSSLKS
jgi:mono/diheme cytochrome c family protein